MGSLGGASILILALWNTESVESLEGSQSFASVVYRAL
jgi:hypothetical protein